MMINFSIPNNWLNNLRTWFARANLERFIIYTAIVVGGIATAIALKSDTIIAYGDAESHLNIAKRVVDSITPGLAQLGGIWLPLPHLLMVPLVKIDFLWRTGLAGSIVSGIAFVISAVFLYRLVLLLTNSRAGAFIGALVFMTNMNVLYLQATPMTELTLIVFFVLSSYFFTKYIQDDRRLNDLLLAALFGFCAALSRYDGWFLIGIEMGIIGLMYLPWHRVPRKVHQIKEYWSSERWARMEGTVIMFVTLAFFAVVLWLGWGKLILGDPLYFTHSQFSAASQQQSWASRGELPAMRHWGIAILYYFVTAMANEGVLVWLMAIAGFWFYLRKAGGLKHWLVTLLLGSTFIFNVLTLWLGQSVIFIPAITPTTFEWTLFNVRYGVMMAPFAAVFVGYLFAHLKWPGRTVVVGLLLAQLALYGIGYAQIITLQDGTVGLSHAKRPDAEQWLKAHYDGGLVLVDDYARTTSVIRSGIPMQEVIYIGNKPYWDQSLLEPERYATWIVMQQNDSVWQAIYDPPLMQARLYKYFEKSYTSPEILIFKRNPNVPPPTYN